MPILDIQKRARELGRIRIGQVVPTNNGKTRPEKLDRFRLTSNARHLLEKVAELYGGTVEEWTPQGGGTKAWEVITTSTRLPIMVPPQPVTQWYEYWTRAGCIHRCDGQTNVLTMEPCDPEDEAHLEALRKPTTRLNVVLRDVEGIGVWRLETHGWNAAVELPDAAQFLAQAGGYVEGWVSLEQRTSIGVNARTGKPETRHFMVPIIEIDVTPAELMAGRGRVATPTIEGPVSAAAAIEAPKPADAPAASAAPSLPTPEQIAGADLTTLRKMAAYLSQAVPDNHPAVAAVETRLHQLEQAASPQPDAEGVVDAEVVEEPAPAAASPAQAVAPSTAEPDPDVVWQQVLKAGGEKGMSLGDLEDDFIRVMGISAAEASGSELASYLHTLTTGEMPKGQVA